MTKLLHTFADLPATAWRIWLEHWRLLWVRVVLMGALALLSLGIAQLVGIYCLTNWRAMSAGSRG